MDKFSANSRKKVLPEKRMEALKDLHINPTHKRKRDESPVFLLYLNYAVNNICDIAGLPENTTSDGIDNAIKQAGSGAIRKLANFFWLFQADEPEKNYPEYEKYTIAIARKIFELREYFTHLKYDGVQALVVNQDFYRFVGGSLASAALEAAVQPGLRTAKLFKMKLFSVRDREKQLYEFTRRGLVFLITIALFKDEAHEFTQCLEDMQIPNCPKDKPADEDCVCECDNIAVCKSGVAKAFVAMFTHFSTRRGRSVNLLEDDLHYLSFANISGYLNKVPADSFDYLTLDRENEMLRSKCEASTESEENKKFKYSLHKRAKDRFLSFGAAYFEDFRLLDCVKFKRLDISMEPGRKRYFFGVEHDNRVRMDRHYHINSGAIRFSWNPAEHYGPIHIDSLRSTMSAGMMKELLYAAFAGENPNRAVNDYFTAYHRILETVLNTEDVSDLSLSSGTFLEDFVRVTRLAPETIKKDPSVLNDFFPENLIRFFSGDNSSLDDETLRELLIWKMSRQVEHAEDFLVRFGKFEQWKEDLGKLRKEDPGARLPVPVCSAEEVLHPPFTCNFSDGKLIAEVFSYFNLYLANDKKFRQLPPGEQHRGEVDHEYQFVHALIGKFSMDSKGLEYFIKKRKTELLPAWDKICSELKTIREREMKKRPPDRYGRRKKPNFTLAMLAEAAVNSKIKYLKEKIKLWENTPPADPELLRKNCRRFGIRPGMPFDRTALIKTILRIDPVTWSNAYDYQNRAKYELRSLDQQGHIVTQVPFPRDFAGRIMLDSKKPGMKSFLPESGKFDFGAAVRALPVHIRLRDFYDVSPLIAAGFAVKQGVALDDITGLKTTVEIGEFPADFSRNALKKALSRIKEAYHQDILLAEMAYAYWNAFQVKGAFLCRKKKDRGKIETSEAPSIYEYFEASVQLKFKEGKDERIISIMPNDINRPVLSQVKEFAAEIAAFMDPDGTQQEFEFYEMLKAYRQLQSLDRQKRLAVIPLIMAFDNAVFILQSFYSKGADNRAMEFMHFKGKFRRLSREDYDEIVNCRNRVFHNGLGIDIAGLENLLKKYVSLPGERVRFSGSGKRWW